MNSIISMHILLIFQLLLLSCVNSSETKQKPKEKNPTIIIEDKSITDTNIVALSSVHDKDYNLVKIDVNQLRSVLEKKYINISDKVKQDQFLDSTMVVFTDYLITIIVPHWYETKWSFEGHSATPNKGEIACGYFVSTTLRDMGLNLNRYRLAQQGPEEEVASISIDQKNMITVKNHQLDSVFTILKTKYNPTLFFVGLDFHVGYLYLKDNQSYFIHSNYIDGHVMIENTINSKAFRSEKYFISNITGNRLLAKKWLFYDKIKIILSK